MSEMPNGYYTEDNKGIIYKKIISNHFNISLK